jgi:peptidoglycan-associated lipoprotein
LVLIDLNVYIEKASNISSILFDLGKADINEGAAKELHPIATIVLDQNSLTIELRSHMKSRGADSNNLKLSQERVNLPVHHFVSQGVSYSQLKAVGFGEHQFLNKCINGVECSEKKHAANRRAE